MGLFDEYDANPEDLPDPSGIEPGAYPARVKAVEVKFNVYKQDGKDNDKFIVFTYDVEGASFDINHNFAMPRPKPWSETDIEYGSVTVADAMKQHLARFAKHLENLGVPRSKQNDIELEDLVGIEGVVTMTKNKKGYVNPSKFVVKQDSGASLPESDGLSGW